MANRFHWTRTNGLGVVSSRCRTRGWVQCYDPWIDQGVAGCLSCFRLTLAVTLINFHFMSFLVRWDFHSVLTYSGYWRSAVVYWSSNDSIHRWIPYGSDDRCVQDLLEDVFTSRKRDPSEVLGANRLYAAWAVAWVVSTAELCSMASAVCYMHTHSQKDTKVVDPSPGSLSVPDDHEADSDVEDECDLKDILPSAKIDVPKNLRVNSTVIRNKCVSSTPLKCRRRLLFSSNWRCAVWKVLMSRGSSWRVCTSWTLLLGRRRDRCCRFSVTYRSILQS